MASYFEQCSSEFPFPLNHLKWQVHGLKLWAPCEIMESSLIVKVLGDQAPKCLLP